MLLHYYAGDYATADESAACRMLLLKSDDIETRYAMAYATERDDAMMSDVTPMSDEWRAT